MLRTILKQHYIFIFLVIIFCNRFQGDLYALDYEIVHPCNGHEGQIDIQLPPKNYNYQWKGPNGFQNNEEDLNDIGPGIYDLTITDNEGCWLKQSFELTDQLDCTDANFLVQYSEGDFNVPLCVIDVIDKSYPYDLPDWAYNWDWDGGTVELIGEESQSYHIKWDTPGTYTISLTITNPSTGETDTETKEISVGSEGEGCPCEIDKIPDEESPQNKGFFVRCFFDDWDALKLIFNLYADETEAGPYTTYINGQEIAQVSGTTENGNEGQTWVFNSWFPEQPYLTEYEILIINANGCIYHHYISCNDVDPITGIGEPNPDEGPLFITDFTDLSTICAGDEFCIDYEVQAYYTPISVSIFNNSTINSKGWYHYIDSYGLSDHIAKGTFCWTPSIDDIGTHTFTVEAMDDHNDYKLAHQSFSLEVFCDNTCPNCVNCYPHNDWFEITDAIEGCDYLVRDGNITFLSHTDPDCDVFITGQLKGSNTAPQTSVDLPPGENQVVCYFNEQEMITLPIDIDITILEDIKAELIDLSHEYNDNCNGSAKIEASGGGGDYYYTWFKGQEVIVEGMGIDELSGLCAEEYKVAVKDDYGCSGELTFIVKAIRDGYYTGQDPKSQTDDSRSDQSGAAKTTTIQKDRFSVNPNPFRDNIYISFMLAEEEHKENINARIALYDLTGKEIDVFLQSEVAANTTYDMSFDLSHLPNGIYFIRLEHPNQSKAKAIKIVKH